MDIDIILIYICDIICTFYEKREQLNTDNVRTVQAWRTVNKQITCGVIRPYLHTCPNMVTR